MIRAIRKRRTTAFRGIPLNSRAWLLWTIRFDLGCRTFEAALSLGLVETSAPGTHCLIERSCASPAHFVLHILSKSLNQSSLVCCGGEAIRKGRRTSQVGIRRIDDLQQ